MTSFLIELRCMEIRVLLAAFVSEDYNSFTCYNKPLKLISLWFESVKRDLIPGRSYQNTRISVFLVQISRILKLWFEDWPLKWIFINKFTFRLRKLNTYLRSIMGNNRLHALMLLYVRKNILDNINLEKMYRKDSRKQIFRHFSQNYS